MSVKVNPPRAERGQTDSSLAAERQKTDRELSGGRTRAEDDADEVVRHSREQADETLEAARTMSDAKLVDGGASMEAFASAKAQQGTEDTALDAERRTADVQLQKEREERRRAVASLLHLERGLTDEHLMLERVRSDEVLARVLDELGEAVRLREQFLSVASHEFKTPLTPLALRLQSLSREAAKQPETPFVHQVASYIGAASRQAKKLSALIADLLDVSRMAKGEPSLNLGPVDFGAVVRDAVMLQRAEAEKAGCELEVEAPSVTGRWDELRLGQVVTNLLRNAIKYGAEKPIRVHLWADSDKATLSVRDEGIGIAAEHLPRIFGRFERAVSDRNYGGLGLGLFICKTVVEAMGGTITAQSELGRGSTFTVELPLAGPKSATSERIPER